MNINYRPSNCSQVYDNVVACLRSLTKDTIIRHFVTYEDCMVHNTADNLGWKLCVSDIRHQKDFFPLNIKMKF